MPVFKYWLTDSKSKLGADEFHVFFHAVSGMKWHVAIFVPVLLYGKWVKNENWMDPLCVWQMQCEFVMVNIFYLSQALDKMQKQALTLGLELEAGNGLFLWWTLGWRITLIFHFYSSSASWFVWLLSCNRMCSTKGTENVAGSQLPYAEDALHRSWRMWFEIFLEQRMWVCLFHMLVENPNNICPEGYSEMKEE